VALPVALTGMCWTMLAREVPIMANDKQTEMCMMGRLRALEL
jgi:hypothetical protein